MLQEKKRDMAFGNRGGDIGKNGRSAYPSEEQINQNFDNLLNADTFNESYTFLFDFARKFYLEDSYSQKLLPLFNFYGPEFAESPEIREKITMLLNEFASSKYVSKFLIDNKFHEIIYDDFPKYGTLKIISKFLYFDIATDEFDECGKFPKESVYYNEYQKAYDELAFKEKYNHVAHFYLEKNVEEKMKHCDTNEILECMYNFGKYYFSFEHFKDILNDIYGLLFSDSSDIMTKATCIDIFGSFAKSSLDGLYFTINRPEFINLFKIDINCELIDPLIYYIERAFNAFNFIPEDICICMIDFLIKCIQTNDTKIMCNAICSFSYGYKGLEKFSQFCYDNNYVQKFFDMLYNENYPFNVQIELVGVICRIFSVSSQEVSAAIFDMGILQLLHDYMESTANYIIEDLLEAIHNLLYISEVNSNYKEWSELLFSDDDIVKVIEDYSYEIGHVEDTGVNTVEILAYSILSKNPYA